MASVKQKDTGPEISVRRELHRKDLPGSPDIVLPKYKAVIFVHGCFWHQHDGCKFAGRPKNNKDYWDNKLDENVLRDAKKERQLKQMGWKVLVIWQCEIKNMKEAMDEIEGLLLTESNEIV